MLKRLAAGLIHLLGGSTAEEVEYIERQWQGKLARGQNPPCTPGAGGSGGAGHTPAMSWPSDGPLFIPAAPGPQQTLIITPTAPADKPTAPLHKGTERMSGPERRELARAAAQWCKQQGIEANPENVIFYLDNGGHLIRHA